MLDAPRMPKDVAALILRAEKELPGEFVAYPLDSGMTMEEFKAELLERLENAKRPPGERRTPPRPVQEKAPVPTERTVFPIPEISVPSTENENGGSGKGKGAARIQVIGIAEEGNRVVTHMIETEIRDIEFFCIDREFRYSHAPQAATCIETASYLPGLADDVFIRFEQEAELAKNKILHAMQGADVVCMATLLGRTIGDVMAPLVASSAKEQGALSIAVVTYPFVFEGLNRRRRAGQAVEKLKGSTDVLLVIPGDGLYHLMDKKATIRDAFNKAVEVVSWDIQQIIAALKAGDRADLHPALEKLREELPDDEEMDIGDWYWQGKRGKL